MTRLLGLIVLALLLFASVGLGQTANVMEVRDNLVLKNCDRNKQNCVPKNDDLDDADLIEVTARFAWVFMNNALPADALARTTTRANSSRSSLTGLMNTGPAKRLFSILTLSQHNAIVSKETIPDLKLEIESLKRDRDQMRSEIEGLKEQVRKLGNE